LERLRQILAEDRKKLAGKRPSDILWYVWTYYRVQLGLIIGILGLGIYLLFLQLTVPGTVGFYACFANTFKDYGPGSALYREYAEYAELNLKKTRLIFNCSIYCNPSRNMMGNRYYEALITLIDSGSLDVIIMSKEDLCALGANGRLLDLSSEKAGGLAEAWQDRLCTTVPADPEYGTSPIPVGIDLTGSRIVGDYEAYAGDAWLGISSESTRVDQAALFLRFLFSMPHP